MTKETSRRGISLPIFPSLPPAPAVCKGCGECCRALIVELTAGDQGPRRYLTEEDGYLHMRQRKDLTCLALDRTTSRCRIYERRPTVCREFPHGGLRCRQVTQHLKLIPRLR